MTDLSADTVSLEEGVPVSEQLVRAVAAREGVAPFELEAPLYDTIDPDALDRLFRSFRSDPPTDAEVVFRYHGSLVTITVGDALELRLEDDPAYTPDVPPSEAFLDDGPLEDDLPTADVHYCLDCGWRISARDGHSTAVRSRRAIEHHVQTGHTIDSHRPDD